jgi:putative Mg2+ transporter-C (MgtC) family protein
MPGDVELLPRVRVGAALGAALGMEREHRGQVGGCGRTAWRPAARRIFMLAGAYGCAAVHRGSNVDPMRVAAQAAAGVGFIGGGAILKGARRSAV